jgi:hypothetical protein
MRFVELTQADGSPVLISIREIVTCAPVPRDAVLEEGTRITFRNGGQQDVREPYAEVRRRLAALAPEHACDTGDDIGI